MVLGTYPDMKTHEFDQVAVDRFARTLEPLIPESELPPSRQQTLVAYLSIVELMTQTEISKVLWISTSTVEMHFEKIKRRVDVQLSDLNMRRPMSPRTKGAHWRRVLTAEYWRQVGREESA